MHWNTEQRFFVSVKKKNLLHTFTAKDSVVKLEFTKSGTDSWSGVLKWQHFKKIYFSCLKFTDSWLFLKLSFSSVFTLSLALFWPHIIFPKGYVNLVPLEIEIGSQHVEATYQDAHTNLDRKTLNWNTFQKMLLSTTSLVLLTSFAWQALSSLAVVPFNFMSF